MASSYGNWLLWPEVMATDCCGQKWWQLITVARSYGNWVLWPVVMATECCGQKLWQLIAVARIYGNWVLWSKVGRVRVATQSWGARTFWPVVNSQNNRANWMTQVSVIMHVRRFILIISVSVSTLLTTLCRGQKNSCKYSRLFTAVYCKYFWISDQTVISRCQSGLFYDYLQITSTILPTDSNVGWSV